MMETMTVRSDTAPHQRLASLSDIRALMLEETFKEVDFDATLVKEATITGTPFQRRSSRSVLSVNDPNNGSDKETSCGSSPKRNLLRSVSLANFKSMSLSSRRLTHNGEVCDPWADASPVLSISDHLSTNLKRECRRALKFLLRLQEPPLSRTSISQDPIMPPTALKFSKGLAFIRQHKAGLLTSWTWGSGFVIARLGPGRWSAPCFLSDKFLSCGLTCGYRTVDTCYAIPTNAGMKHFKVDSLNSAFDLGLTLGFDPLQGEAPIATAQSADRTTGRYALNGAEKPKIFHVSDGVILDLSWRFGMHFIDDKIHQQLYGVNVTPSDILEGKVQIPVEFKPFYEMLSALALEGDVVKPTVSMFEVEKEKNKLKSQHSLSSSLSFPRKKGGKLSSSGSDYNSHSNESIGYVSKNSMNDSALIGTSFPNSIGSQYSASPLPSPGSGGGGGEEKENGSFHRLFEDTELLDLDLDSPEDTAEEEIKPEEKAPCCYHT